MGKFYISAPVDEVLLAEEVAPLVASWQGTLPTSEALRNLAHTHDLDYATMALYQSILASPSDRAFIDAVNQQPLQSRHAPIGEKVLVIPALFHGHFPETGADAKFARDIAANCGFDVGTIPIGSVATVSDNADIIRDMLEKESAEKIWIFAVSKGSADFRLFLQRYPDSPAIRRLRGWINVCGLPFGCHITDANKRTPWNRLKYRLICRLFGVSYKLMRELGTDYAAWQAPLTLPAHMQAFNFSAIPLGSHIQTSLIGRYKAIRHLGPNDGMVACRDSIIDSAPTYPVWGCDHFFRSPQVVPILYRFFSFLRTRCVA
ncbi:MAG: hypothetical protein V7642_6203 [Burkholderiales bacterium]|jgi:hypothetical protein